MSLSGRRARGERGGLRFLEVDKGLLTDAQRYQHVKPSSVRERAQCEAFVCGNLVRDKAGQTSSKNSGRAAFVQLYTCM